MLSFSCIELVFEPLLAACFLYSIMGIKYAQLS